MPPVTSADPDVPRTHLPLRERESGDPRPPRPRVRTRGLTPEALVHHLAALLGAFALAWLLFEQVLPVRGTIGFWLVWYLLFLTLLAAVSSTTLDRQGVIDRLTAALVTTCGLVLVTVLAGIVVFTFLRGRSALGHLNFYTQTTALVGPDAPLDQGGILAAMAGTAEQVGISMLISVPLGLATAVYLSEVGGRLADAVRRVVETMSSVPTIVAGLFVYSMMIIQFGFDRSGFAAALALCVSMIPVVTTTAEVVLRLVPNGLREASLALGTSRWQTVSRVVLPTALPGLVTAVLLGVARVIGETAPVLLVAGNTSEMNLDPLEGPQLSLPLFIFTQVRLPLDQAIERAFGAGVVLLTLVVLFFSLARIVGGRAPGRVSRRQQRRLAARFDQRSERPDQIDAGDQPDHEGDLP